LTAEDIEDYEEQEPIFCPACEERGYKERIGPKILMANEPRPDNYEDLWECAVCGLSGDVSQIPKEEQIKNMIETTDDPLADKTIIESLPSRSFYKTGKKVARSRPGKRKKKVLHKDPDINALMRIYGDRVKVVFDSNP